MRNLLYKLVPTLGILLAEIKDAFQNRGFVMEMMIVLIIREFVNFIFEFFVNKILFFKVMRNKTVQVS
jgi:hypothetical protein